MMRLRLPALPPPLAAGSGLLLGLSGGLDSRVLLHLLATPPRPFALPLRAIHVHHGLDPAADAWARQCQSACDALGVPLVVARVAVPRDTGLGPEGGARQARHAAFAAALRDGEILVLAHHQDDQAETFLLRALRGSGVDGLAAMQPWRTLGAGWAWRPLLKVPRQALLQHATAHALPWIEDPSNGDPALDRGFLRREVLPVLARRWPQAQAALARSAALCADAATLLRDEDADALPPLLGRDPHWLDAGALAAMPRPRRARLLRHWIARLGLPPLPAQGVDCVEADLLPAAVDAQAAFAWSGARLRRWRQWLHAGVDAAPLPAGWTAEWDGAAPLSLPGGGRLWLEGATRFDAPLQVRARRGGERLRLPGRAHHHALKHALQAAGVPPWERERLPVLLSADGTVLAAGDRVLGAALEGWLRPRQARLCWAAAGGVAACSAPAG